MHKRLVWSLVALGLIAAACGSTPPESTQAPPSSGANALQSEVASVDLYTKTPQRVEVGLFFGNGNLVSFGTADFRFYTGPASAEISPQPGPQATASYVPTPGTPDGSGQAPAITSPTQARGVFEAESVTFDRAGIWLVDVSVDVPGRGTLTSSTQFQVADRPALPAPGQKALRTENLTIHSKGVPKAAIDSRYTTDGKIPDPELHETTIADAIREHRPALVVFSTPVYCESRFCGPVTDMVAALSKRYADRAEFIHVEIWRDFQNQVINKGAADWLYRNGDMTEPWLYLIGANGVILDRWNSLMKESEIAAELQELPVMK